MPAGRARPRRRRAKRSSRWAWERRRRTAWSGWCAFACDGGRRSGGSLVTASLPAGTGRRPVLAHGFELVADAVPRLDERVLRRTAVDLLPEPADEHVDRPVAVRLAPSPELLEQLVAGRDASLVECELVEEAELCRCQAGALPVHERLHFARIDHELLDLDRLPPRCLVSSSAAARGGAYPRDELLHGERLHEVVVGADLERVHAVVLGAARGDHHDRGADSLRTNRLDQLPAVEPGEHQIEHADVRLLVAEPGETLVSIAVPEC